MLQGKSNSSVAGTSQWSVQIRLPNERRSLSRSAARALDVLEYFGQARRPLRAIEIAHALQLHPSTTNQLLKTMVESAYLVFDGRTKTYLPSPRLAGFSGWLVENYGTDEPLHGLVRAVRSATGRLVNSSSPNGLFMQVLDLDGEGTLWVERGLSTSVFGSTTGSAYLSTLADEEIMQLAARARILPAELPQFLNIISEIRIRGFADGLSPHTAAAWSIAVPLPSQRFAVPFVLGLTGTPEQVRGCRLELYQQMREAISQWIVPNGKRSSAAILGPV